MGANLVAIKLSQELMHAKELLKELSYTANLTSPERSKEGKTGTKYGQLTT